jgi:hypothetical protein
MRFLLGEKGSGSTSFVIARIADFADLALS